MLRDHLSSAPSHIEAYLTRQLNSSRSPWASLARSTTTITADHDRKVKAILQSAIAVARAMMPDWRDEYLASLRESEKNSPVNKDLVDACSQLADRVAALEAEKAVLLQKQQHIQTAQPQPESQLGAFSSALRAATRSPRQQPQLDTPVPNANPPSVVSTSLLSPGGAGIDNNNTADAAQTRLQLAEALRSRGQLQIKLRAAEDELRRLRNSTQVAAKQVHDLKAERGVLQGRLRDRGEELEAKTKAFLDVQDENLALNLEIASQDRRMADIRAENKQLIDRWMKRMGEEADAMNLANEPDPAVAASRKR